jgi:hypothetical protein
LTSHSHQHAGTPNDGTPCALQIVLRPTRTILILIGACLWLSAGRAADRFLLDATIDGKSVCLCLDTGADTFYLFRSAAERLGMRMPSSQGAPGAGEPFWAAEKSTLDWGGSSRKVRFAIIEMPSYLQVPEEGLVGWSGLKDRIILFDTIRRKIEFLDKVPGEATGWTKLRLRTRRPPGGRKWCILALEVPGTGRSKGAVIVDTGSTSGVGLRPQAWGEWKVEHAGQPRTLAAEFTPSVGMMVREQAWASALRLGPLELTSVVVEEADPWSLALLPTGHVATLGIAALKRLDLIVDGRRGIAYLRPKATTPTPYEHNRYGAVFVPRDEKNDDLVARVVEGSPAYESGVRDGDVLVSAGGRDMSGWRKKPGGLVAFWSGPAGTKLAVTVKRGERTVETTTVLRDILPPEDRPSVSGSE